MADYGDSSGYQQQFYMDREDLLRLLHGLEESKPQYWISDVQSDSGEFASYNTVAALDEDTAIGLPKFGGCADYTLGIQFLPHIPIPVRTLTIAPHKKPSRTVFMQELPKAGMPLLSWGGWYAKKGEIISGRVAFSTWIDTANGKLNFKDRLEHYHRILLLAKKQGAREIKGWLIGTSAWEKYNRGVPLVLYTGLTPLARFSTK